ncbi:MAG: hypothetical protein MZV70_62410 [Desulfobacterales bacterium]|nr:hypothetical protein [Desulfobacterales bacterium]
MMTAQIDQGMCPCNAPGIEAYRLLTLPDGGQVRVKWLDKIFEEAYREGKGPDLSVANELVSRLSENNYIPSGARTEYEIAVFKEYQKFFEEREKRRAR